jgi:hypothetical protein
LTHPRADHLFELIISLVSEGMLVRFIWLPLFSFVLDLINDVLLGDVVSASNTDGSITELSELSSYS